MRRRILKFLLASTVFVTGLELALQAGHLLVGSGSRPAGAGPSSGASILCLGDSHTFGAGVDASEAYPARLEGLLRERGYDADVVNLGAPGTNTSEIRRRMPGLLDAYQPVAVIVLAGVNNGWNRKDQAWSDMQDGLPAPWTARAADFILTRVRLVKGAYVLLHRLDWTGPKEERARDRTGKRVIHSKQDPHELEGPAKTYARARRDLVAIIARARAAHAVPVLMTYVSDPEYTFYGPNRLIREVAGSMKAPLADNDKALRPGFMEEDGSVDKKARDRLFFPDMHPGPGGYELISENVLETLERAGVLSSLPTKEEIK